MVTTPAQVAPRDRPRACRIAQATRSVTCVIVPNDVQEEPLRGRRRASTARCFSGGAITAPRVLPADADLRRAAEVLNAGATVAMLVGQGARGAAAEVDRRSPTRWAPAWPSALNGRDVLPDDLPFVTGSIGLLGTEAERRR